MNRVCPLCNGLAKHEETCLCGVLMEDAGPVADYYGPYSPYFNLSFEDPVCHHLFRCPKCGQERDVAVPRQNP